MTQSRLRVLLQASALLGALLLAAGICWGFAERAHVVHLGTTVLLTAGTAACLAALVGAVVVERRPWGLVLPPGARLPSPSWTGPLLLTGVCDIVGGAYASPVLLVVGTLLVLGALVGAARHVHRPGTRGPERGFDLTAELAGRPDPEPVGNPDQAGTSASGPAAAPRAARPDRDTVVAARRLQDFGRRHAVDADATVDCLIEHTGRDTARIVVVGRDGAFGDVVVRGRARAELAVALAGADVHEPGSRTAGARIRTGGYEWRRMAGMQLRSPNGE